MVVNNTFGSCHYFVEDHVRDIHMVMWYDLPNHEHGQTEDCYFSPKNIVIANNAFIDSGSENKKSILFAASRGINDPDTTNMSSVDLSSNISSLYFPNVDHVGNLRDSIPDVGAFEAYDGP